MAYRDGVKLSPKRGKRGCQIISGSGGYHIIDNEVSSWWRMRVLWTNATGSAEDCPGI